MNIHRIARVATDKDESYRQDQVSKMGQARIATEEKSELSDKSDIKMVSAELNKFSSVFDMESFNEVKGMLLEVINSLTVSHVNVSEVVKEYPSEEIINLTKMVYKDDSLV